MLGPETGTFQSHHKDQVGSLLSCLPGRKVNRTGSSRSWEEASVFLIQKPVPAPTLFLKFSRPPT